MREATSFFSLTHTDTKKPLRRPVRSVKVCAGGNTIVSGGADGIVKIWNMKTGEKLAEMRHCDSVSGLLTNTVRVSKKPVPICSVGMSADGTSLVSAAEDGTARTWIPAATASGFDIHDTVHKKLLTLSEYRIVAEESAPSEHLSDPLSESSEVVSLLELAADILLELLKEVFSPTHQFTVTAATAAVNQSLSAVTEVIANNVEQLVQRMETKAKASEEPPPLKISQTRSRTLM